MIDFTNKNLIKLKMTDNSEGETAVKDLLIDNENVQFSFVSMRDKLVFTDKRMIAVNVQGITGKKIDYTSIPYPNIQVYSVETSGNFDLDSEIDITISGLGTVRFELNAQTDIKQWGKFMSSKIL